MPLQLVRGDITTFATDAIVNAAKRMGISPDHAATAMADHQGVAIQYDAVSEAMCQMRACDRPAADRKQVVEEDTCKRKHRGV